MRLLFSSALLGLAWFGAINLVTSLAAWRISRVLTNSRRHVQIHRPSVLLFVRLLPSATSFVFVLAFFLPAHWRFEPADAVERFGVVFGSLAALSLALLGRSLWRAGSVCRTGLRLRTHMRRGAVVPGVNAIELGGVPGVVLAGVFRPQVVVGTEVRAALTAPELEVALAHEVAHERSRDNLKSLAMYCAPDAFGWFASARGLEARWRAEAECLADARAVDGDDRRALALASALVKVARLTSQRPPALRSPAWSSFHEPGLLEIRVRRLVQRAPDMGRAPATLRGALAIVALGLASGGWLSDSFYGLHRLTEALVFILP